MNKLATVLSLVVVGFVSGCSRLDIAVDWADYYIASSVDDYFDISSRQNKELKQSLKNDIVRIRYEQFSKWADFLRRLEKDLTQGKLTSEAVQGYFTEVRDASRKLPSFFTETAVEFVSTLTPEQLVYFEKETKKKDLEREEKLKDPLKAKKEVRKKHIQGIEMWIDSLTEQQELLLDQHLSEHPFPRKEQLKNRNLVADKFREAQKSPEDLKKFVRAYYSDMTQFFDPDYRKAVELYQAELSRFIFNFTSTLTDKQKKIFSENLLERASALERLAEKK